MLKKIIIYGIVSVLLISIGGCVSLTTLESRSDSVKIIINTGASNIDTKRAIDSTAMRAGEECGVYGKSAEFVSVERREKSKEEAITDAVVGLFGGGTADRGFVATWNCI